MEKRIIIAGSGGQGVLFIGKLLAYAAMLEDREVTWFPSYGAEMRGGTANCTVIISDSMIGSPVIRNPDVLVVMNDDSYRRFVATGWSRRTRRCRTPTTSGGSPTSGRARTPRPKPTS